jgi:type I restriction enzyme S subunit
MNIDRSGTIVMDDVKYVEPRHDRLLRPGDVLFNNTNSPELVGKTAAVCQDAVLAFSNHMTRLRPAEEVSPGFLARQLHYLWMAGYFRHRCTHHVNQASIASETLAQTVPVLLAPANEQERVTEKLDELLTDLDAGVAALERVERNLERYRASVLKAAVEGRLTAAWREEHPDVQPASELLARILAERRRRWEAAQLARFEAKGNKPPKNWASAYPQPVVSKRGDLPPLPPRWYWATLDQLLWYLRNGYGKKPDAEDGVPILRISALRPLSVNLADVRFLPGPAERYEAFHLSEGDLLFTRFNGNTELVGVCGVVPRLSRTLVHPDKLIRGRTVPQLCLPRYLEIALNTGLPRESIARHVKTTAGQAGISGSDLKTAVVPLPPVEEQVQIVAAFQEMWSIAQAVRASVRAGLARASRLRQSILKRAFEGRLVAQEPGDEPAWALLERIRAARGGQPPCRTQRGRRQSL